MSYVALANITLGTSASSVTFSSIPATFRDLVLVVDATVPTQGVPRMRVNSDTSSNYNRIELYGDSSGVYTGSVNQTFFDLGRSGTGFTGSRFMGIVNFMDYAQTDRHKTILGQNNDDNARALAITSQRWANTAAINQIQVILSANTYAAGSTFALFGIAG